MMVLGEKKTRYLTKLFFVKRGEQWEPRFTKKGFVKYLGFFCPRTIIIYVCALNQIISPKHAVYAWNSYTLILLFIAFGCNISIWRKFQRGSVASHQQNIAEQNKRLTKTLLFESVLALLSWVHLVIMNFLIFVFYVSIPLRFYGLVNVVNYSNSFVNPVVYALRIPEFKQALTLCCRMEGKRRLTMKVPKEEITRRLL